MAITARLVGRLGGGQVDVNPVSGSQSGTSWKTIHTVQVPAGETMLVCAAGTMVTTGSSNSSAGLFAVGSAEYTTPNGAGTYPLAGAAEVTGPATVNIQVTTTGLFGFTAAFDGTVYVTPLG